MRRLALAIAVLGLLLVSASAPARVVRLRPAASLQAASAASSKGPIVRLHWRDRSHGESRWEVWRGGRRRAALKPNRRAGPTAA